MLERQNNHRVGRVLGLIVLIGMIGLALWQWQHVDVAHWRNVIDGLGVWGMGAFVLIYAVATVLFLPGSLFTMSAGALYGPVWGTALSLIGATLGATLAFWVSRYILGHWVQRRVEGKRKQLLARVDEEGWRVVALLRLVPLVPFNVLNYLLGITSIGTMTYAMTSLVCMLPGSFVYAYLGHAGAQVAAGERQALMSVLIALGAFALLGFVVSLYRRRVQDALA